MYHNMKQTLWRCILQSFTACIHTNTHPLSHTQAYTVCRIHEANELLIKDTSHTNKSIIWSQSSPETITYTIAFYIVTNCHNKNTIIVNSIVIMYFKHMYS